MTKRITRTVALAATFLVVAAGCGGSEVTLEEVDSSTTTSSAVNASADPSPTEATARTETFDVSGESGASDVNKQVQPSTFTATVTGSQATAYAEPSVESATVETFASPNVYDGITGGPVAFQSINHQTRPDGWVQVLLPIRPNGSTGWIQESEVSLLENSFRIEVDRSAHELRLFDRGNVIETSPVAIGTGDTPTPVGSFYITELLQPKDPESPYGSFAYGLSGFSETLDEFNGGDGVVGIHGTNDPSSIGTDVSHGCIRLENEVIEKMAQSVPLGTPVYIT